MLLCSNSQWYYYESNQQDATIQVNLLFLVSSTCFGPCFRPLSGALDYLQYLVVFTQVAASRCLWWVETELWGLWCVYTSSSSSSVGATARCGLWPVEQYLSICPYLSATLSIFSLPALEDLFPLLFSILSWVFLFISVRPVLEWRSFWASYPPLFSPGDPAKLSFAHLSILLYFLLYSTLLVLDTS